MERALPRKAGFKTREFLIGCCVLLFLAAAGASRADQVQMLDGDQYFGQVLSVDANMVVLKSQLLGTLRLPRAKVAQVGFGISATNRPSGQALAQSPTAGAFPSATNASPALSGALKQLAAQSNLVDQVRKQYLAGAGPDANAKFDELLNGLLSGQMNIGDLRAQAKTAADQIRAAKTELGPETGGLLDTYLLVLDNFLKETGNEPGASSATAPLKPPTTHAQPTSH
ncbi:MAG TPA: hypothetical protein VG167_07850 [Verrucomicrobiae bacterium]|nr:hypothetical protein [Verrucomicrobiae bacterium]